ncbi:hypothetical protein BGX24_007476 [Mortierella sp. AD032]|nr:hypothetical protein BGX24_007476 [Mortierella sp. AD032]
MANLDYFIHTPTISVGVDYNVKDHIDYVVGIFDTHSEVDVETCKVEGSPILKFRFDNAENLVIPDDLYHRMYCHVLAKNYLSMNGFRSRLIQRMTRAGCVVKGKSDQLPPDSPVIADLKEKEVEITVALHRQIACADPISVAEFEELSFGAQELSAAQRAPVHKFALMRTYDVQDHSIVTKEWVEMYDKAREKEATRTSKLCLPTLDSLCNQLGLAYSLRGATSAEAHSKLERSQFVKLGYVVDILLACGFEDPFATIEVPVEDLKSRVDGIWAELDSKMTQICTTLKK